MIVTYGSTANFTIIYETDPNNSAFDPTPFCKAILDYCEYDLARLYVLFGTLIPIAPPQIPIYVIPGTGGASEDGHSITVYWAPTDSPSAAPALVAAEAAELFMQALQRGWIYNWSHGEALSRVCGQILYPANHGFAPGASWLYPATPPVPANCNPCPPDQLPLDWVDYVCQTDQDEVSVGCGSLFLNFLAYQLNFSWPDILWAGALPNYTLANTAENLGVTDAWTHFLNLMNTYFLGPGQVAPTSTPIIGQPSGPTDNPYPLGNFSVNGPELYLRHNLADDGVSHTGSLSDSPDIIVTGTPAADPQTQYSTAASIASDTESDPAILAGQDYHIYTRTWNRGTNAPNTFTYVYWAPASTLVTPDNWNYIGSAYYPNVPPGQAVTVSNPGILWPADQLPGPGHYCFVAVVGNAWNPPPNPTNFSTFDDFVDYIYLHNNITWRNFNVVEASQQSTGSTGQLLPLPFQITGAWDQARSFSFETNSQLPQGSQLSLELPAWLGHGLMPDPARVQQAVRLEATPTSILKPVEPLPVRLPLNPSGIHPLAEVELPAASATAGNLFVTIPAGVHLEPCNIFVRQLYNGREVGRITWVLMPPRLVLLEPPSAPG